MFARRSVASASGRIIRLIIRGGAGWGGATSAQNGVRPWPVSHSVGGAGLLAACTMAVLRIVHWCQPAVRVDASRGPADRASRGGVFGRDCCPLCRAVGAKGVPTTRPAWEACSVWLEADSAAVVRSRVGVRAYVKGCASGAARSEGGQGSLPATSALQHGP
jgi:hypothetical protein